MPKVSLEAVFTSTGLDKLGRAFDGISQKMKRMADVQKSWGGGSDDAIRRQFKIGMEIDNSNNKIREATKEYRKLQETADSFGKNPAHRKRIEDEMDRVANGIVKETKLRERLNKEVAEEGVQTGRNAMIRRGIKLGLATLGVPYTIAGIARGLQEANAQSMAVSPLAARMVGSSGSGGPQGMKDFTDYSMRLRENIVDTGAAFAYSGRESIQLADTLVTMSGSMKGFRESMEAARTLGLSPQVTTQLLGTARRFGGIGGSGQMDEEKFINMISRGIGESGMGPRGAEYIQSIVSTMQQYSTRVPNVDASVIASVIDAVNKQAAMSGASGLRGSGALQVTQGITSMMDDMSEAMIAIQTQIISRNPGKYGAAASKYGIEGPLQGTAAYGLALALKQEGIAGPDGMKLAGDTIKTILGGQDSNTRKIMESTILRLPMTMIKSLEMGGKNSLMEKLMDGRLTSAEVMRRAVGGNAAGMMQTPGMAFSHLGSVTGAAMSDLFSSVLPAPNTVNAAAEIIEERLPQSGDTAGTADHKRNRLRRFGGQVMGTLGFGATALGFPFAGVPMMAAGMAMVQGSREPVNRSGDRAAIKEINHILDVRITAKEDFNGIASGIAKLAAQIMGTNLKSEASKSQEVGGMNSAVHLDNSKFGMANN